MLECLEDGKRRRQRIATPLELLQRLELSDNLGEAILKVPWALDAKIVTQAVGTRSPHGRPQSAARLCVAHALVFEPRLGTEAVLVDSAAAGFSLSFPHCPSIRKSQIKWLARISLVVP